MAPVAPALGLRMQSDASHVTPGICELPPPVPQGGAVAGCNATLAVRAAWFARSYTLVWPRPAVGGTRQRRRSSSGARGGDKLSRGRPTRSIGVIICDERRSSRTFSHPAGPHGGGPGPETLQVHASASYAVR